MDSTPLDPKVATEAAGTDIQRVGEKRIYSKPVLVAYGRVVDMTRAGGPSAGEARGRPFGG